MQIEEGKINEIEGGEDGCDLGVGDGLVLPDLLGDGGAELGRGDDVVEVVDLHDGGDGAARLPEEVEHAVPRLLHRRRVRRHLHSAHERHLRPLSLSSPLLRPPPLRSQLAAAAGGGGGGRWLRAPGGEGYLRIYLPSDHRPSAQLEI